MLYIYKVNALVMKFNRILILILKVWEIPNLLGIIVYLGNNNEIWEFRENKYVLIIYLLSNSCTKHI